MTLGTATYSPEDNKLRLYPDARLDKEIYDKLRAAGFRWAPRQELFVAPAWAPYRADLLVELAGEIGDEDKTLMDRQEERADRFGGYHDRRIGDAEAAHKAVKAIADNIPFGQPILVGHHSERRARKDAEKIENGMRKAVKMWETAEYWKYRAAAALAHGKYKDRPTVRARRIKKLEAEARKYKRNIGEAETWLKLWEKVDSKEAAIKVANYDNWGYGRYGELIDDKKTWEEVRAETLEARPKTIKHYKRWLEHTERRIEYEKAMLDDQGAADLLKPKPRPKQLPLLNYRAPEGAKGIDGATRWSREPVTFPQVEMTAAEYKRIYRENRYTVQVDGTHRIRVASKIGGRGELNRFCVFLTDSKEHPRPEHGKEVAA